LQMYKIVIVDDEAIVGRGLSEKVEWNELNCTVCATASNGFEGIERIHRFQPDIVITDIKMPGMNGLELAEYVNKHYPNIVTVLLSGYSEFDYARTAVRHQVFDYLLKPIEFVELKACIRKAIDKINGMRASSLQLARESKGKNSAFLESGILMDVIVNGNKDIGVLSKKMKELGISLTNGQIVVFELYESSEPSCEKYASLYQFAVNNIVNETYGNSKLETTIVKIEGKSVVVVKFDPTIQQIIARTRVVEATKLCMENISTYLKKQINVGIGTSFRGMDKLYDSFQYALKILDTHIFWGIHKPELHDSLHDSVTDKVEVQMDPQLFEAIREGDYTNAKQHYDRFTSSIKAYKNKSVALNSCLDFMLGLSKQLHEWEVKDQITQTITEITGYRTFEEYMAAMNRVMAMVCQEAKQRKEEAKGKSLMERILCYLDLHYDESNLNLQYIADIFRVSTGHLSRLFKREKGINFNEYLSMKRVEKAKQLMNEDRRLSVLEIANQVGFTDGKYFGQVFKKYYGITPSDFKVLELR
jgi:two-component system response regulator YesN